MADTSGKSKESIFDKALTGRDIPVLTLDNKWYRLLDEVGRENVKPLENKLNELLKAQGRVNSQIKDIKKLKKKLMGDIVNYADENSEMDRGEAEKKIAENKRLLEECNQKLDEYQEELTDYPFQIDEINKQLMLLTMEHCYETMQDNTDEIEQLEDWVTQVRIELKKNLIRKQEKEAKNHEIYSYMHDIFGPEVVDMFDLRYNPEEQHPMTKSELEQKNQAAEAAEEKA
ncbi:MAG: hypothetical protein MJ130_02535 [Lachnospiraceae bacterium]|nr:hypothetical protein [Lachnospiraceae bacterium]